MTKDYGEFNVKRATQSREIITENLRRLYQETLNEEMPEDLQKLLERLEKADAEKGAKE